MKMFNKKIINLGSLVLLSALVLVMLNGAMHVQAADVSGNGGGGSSSMSGLGSGAGFNATYLTSNHTNSTELINDSDRQAAYGYLIEYKNRLITSNNLDQETKDRLDEVWSGANSYIANSGNNITVARLISYVNETVSNFELVVKEAQAVAGTQDFLFVNTNTIITTANYGEYTYLTLSLINLGKADVTDVVITPQESTDINKWPFVITTASNALVIPKIRASSDINVAHTYAQSATWTFLVSNDAKTGTYPLDFAVQYYRNGAIEKTTVTTYININGNPSAGLLIPEEKDKDAKTSTPRIIVTGFRTEPEVVYAGDTFKLYISVQNTSMETAVSNIQFDLKAASTGSGTDNTYEAFLPTSGSATIFTPVIYAGATSQISIELTARSDLAQKPYVITLSAKYEDSDRNPYTMESNISIPIKQEARVDYGEAELFPSTLEVGSQSNIMFPVYNKGKTTLYNVQVDFIGDSIEGGSTFLGKIEPGGTGNVDAMVTGIAPTMDDGTIIARISYEDEAGNVSTIDKELNLYVMEAFSDEGDFGFYGDYDDFGELDEEGDEKGVYWKPIVIVVVILAIVGIIVWRVVAKKRRQKRLQKELEDIDDDF